VIRSAFCSRPTRLVGFVLC